jgi:hypothetical protein
MKANIGPEQEHQPLLLFFPCTRQVYDWFASQVDAGHPPVTTELLLRQRAFESDPANGIDRRVTCHLCGKAEARYIICRRKGQETDLLFPRRFPLTKHLHRPTCPSFQCETIGTTPGTADNDSQKPTRAARGDFAALWTPQLDPEQRAVPETRVKRVRSHWAHSPVQRTRTTRPTISLRRFASELLQRAGVCDWRPSFQASRSERGFNGLILGALSALIEGEKDGKAAALLRGLPPGTQIVPWSFHDPQYPQRMPDSVATCIGFGFVESLGLPNRHGARAMTLSNFPGQPVLVPAAVLAKEAADPRSPFYPGAPTSNVWTMFVAESFGGVWKIHHLTWFRLSTRGLIPIDSRFEEMMIERMIGERRSFRRWLLPPPELRGSKWIPDFQLVTSGEYGVFVEVAGLMDDPAYLANIRRKEEWLGSRLIVWDTRSPLRELILPTII